MQSLVSLADLARLPGVPAAAIATFSDPDKQAALDARSVYALGKIAGRYKMPLVSWEDDLRLNVVHMALYDLITARGYNPGAGSDVNLRLRFEDADKWLTSVARQEISPNIVGQPDQSPGYDAPRILGQPSQGWQGRRIS